MVLHGLCYNSQTRSMFNTPQCFPRAGCQSYPSPPDEQNPDGFTTLQFVPMQTDGMARGNWIQNISSRGLFLWLRLFDLLEPFFNKTWRPGEIELVP